MTESAQKQAREMGEKQARATHKAHDAAMARNIREYFSKWLYSQPENARGTLTALFNAAYKEEASYYVGQKVSQ